MFFFELFNSSSPIAACLRRNRRFLPSRCQLFNQCCILNDCIETVHMVIAMEKLISFSAVGILWKVESIEVE